MDHLYWSASQSCDPFPCPVVIVVVVVVVVFSYYACSNLMKITIPISDHILVYTHASHKKSKVKNDRLSLYMCIRGL